MAERRKGLGRGIATLLGPSGPDVAGMDVPRETSTPSESDGPKMLPIAYLNPGTAQPRQYFDQEKLVELSQSMRQRGVIQPLVVKQTGATSYDIIAGERRWRAAQLAGLHDVPVVVQDFSDKEAVEVGLIENIQRADLTAYEEATAYQKLIDQFSYSQKAIADSVGKSRSHVANLLRLLTLPKAVIDHIQSGALTMGHARALIGYSDPVSLADRIIKEGLTVRQVEAITSGVAPSGSPKGDPQKSRKDADTIALEKRISAALGMKAKLEHEGETGTLTLTYSSLDQLDDFLSRIGTTD